MALHVGRRGPAHLSRVADAVAGGPISGPADFDLGAAGSAVLERTYASDVVVLSGLAAPASVSVGGGEYAVNGGAWTAVPGAVGDGDQMQVRGVAPATVGATHEVILTVGDVTGAFPIQTVAHAEASAAIARFAAEPNAARRGLIDGCVDALKTAGVWSKLDAFYMLAAHDAQAAQRNWIQDAFHLAPSGGVTFTTDRGYAGDAASGYLDTGFNDLTASALWSQDSMAVGAYVNVPGGVNSFIGLSSGVTLRVGATATNVTTRIHGNTAVNPGFTDPLPGHIAVVRDGATSSRCLRNGVQMGSTSTGASVAGASANVLALRAATAHGADRIACLHLGGALTVSEVAGLYAAILTYLTALGAN